MASLYGKVSRLAVQSPPIVAELQAVFKALPDDVLIAKLTKPTRRGRPSYPARVMWRCFVAYYVLGLPSVSALIRTLYDNPYIAKACGFETPDVIPSQPTFSRFYARLAKPTIAVEVKNIMRALVRQCYDTMPNFGKSVAIDSTDIKAWSHGRGNGHDGKSSDPDAGWAVKKNTEGNKKFVWGYKVHLLVDTTYELPIAADTTAGNVADVTKASALLRQARFTTGKFHPDYVLADAGYSSKGLREHIRRQYRAEPIIDPNPTHLKTVARTPKTAEWKAIYARRTAVERVNSRLKEHRRLNSVRVRGRWKVTLHAVLSVLALQASAVANQSRALVRKVRLGRRWRPRPLFLLCGIPPARGDSHRHKAIEVFGAKFAVYGFRQCAGGNPKLPCHSRNKLI